MFVAEREAAGDEHTRLSRPPPSRSMAPICIEGCTDGTVAVGGARSRLSRSPRRSPCDGMTAGGASDVPDWPTSGLSALSPLRERNFQIIIQKNIYFVNN